MELRHAAKDEVKGGVQSAKKSNTDVTFSKLEQNRVLGKIFRKILK